MSYETNFLSQVIFQANYNSVDLLKSSIDPTLERLCVEKTGTGKTEGKANTINILNNKVSNEVNSTWIFNGTNIQIAVQHNVVQIIIKQYTDHNSFHQIINDVYNSLKRIYKMIMSRVSLRYINSISFSTGSTFDFDNLIDADLLKSTLKFKDLRPSRSMGNMVLAHPDYNITTIFNYGFLTLSSPTLSLKENLY
jgi:uncharacterized protein (TIGR04255 family)